MRPRSRQLLAAVLTAGVAGALLLAIPSAARAAGSAELFPATSAAQTCTAGAAGACRANLEWRTGTYGPAGSAIRRRTVFTVYAHQGEILATGSSAVGVGQGDVFVYDPGVVANDQQAVLPTIVPGQNGFRCSTQRAASGVAAQGRIATRAQELAGPRSADGTANPAGYVPCTYPAPVTGFYKVVFWGPAGGASNADGAPTGDVNLASAANFDARQGTSVAAFDLSVRPDAASATTIRGRVFTYALAAFTGGNGRPVNLSLYVTSSTGYRYRIDSNGLDPNGFLIYGNEQGFLDPEGNPLNHDILGSDGALSTVQGGVSLAAPEYPLSFYPLSDETVAALGIPLTPVVPDLSNLAFAGSAGGSTAQYVQGGTFSFTTNTHGTAAIVISRDGVDFDPGAPANRVLRTIVDAGDHSIVWDGLDNSGDPFPIGTGYQVRAVLRSGFFHFPLLDAENSVEGGPVFTLLNPPNGACPFGNAACTTAFYDDRGYHTSAGGADGTDVGTPGAVLCGLDPPTVTSATITGYDSRTDQRKYGKAPGTNTNRSCTGSFGDAKGLDTWTSYPGATRSSTLDIVAPIAAVDDSGTTPEDVALVVPADRGLLANDQVPAGSTVIASTAPSHGTARVAADGSYVYTPAPGFTGVDTFTYTVQALGGRTATATVTVTVVPTVPLVDDTGATTPGHPVTITPTGNDPGRVEALSIELIDPVTRQPASSVTIPGQGTFELVPGTGRVVFTPAAGFCGRTDALRYLAETGSGQDGVAVIVVSVACPAALRALPATGAPGVSGLGGLAVLLLAVGAGLLAVRRIRARGEGRE